MVGSLTLLLLVAAAAAQRHEAECGKLKDAGPCERYVTRWFFDTEYGSCLRFWYGGCEGNGNNFGSEQECSRVCVSPPSTGVCHLPAVRGPCKRNKLLWYSDPSSGRCREFSYSGCLGNQNRFESEEQCQQRCASELRYRPPSRPQPSPPISSRPGASGDLSDACNLPDRDPGTCRDHVIRYSYVATHQQCAAFYYGGCGGNDNNFASLEECRSVCEKRVQLPAAPRHRAYEREEEPDHLAPESEKQEPEPEQEYPDVAEPVPERDPCSMPKDSGPCRAYHLMYYYDSPSGRCLQFVYGGCLGNANRFRSIEECERQCSAQRPTVTERPESEGPEPGHEYPPIKEPVLEGDPCLMPKDSGPCRAYNLMYYYDNPSGRCLQFVFGGCQGNANRFSSIEECEERCSARPPSATERSETEEPETDHEYPPTTEPILKEDPCSLPKKTGECRASFLKYYYDKPSGRCLQFVYGGCDGNANRFSSIEECEEECSVQPASATELPADIVPEEEAEEVDVPVGPEVCLLPPDQGTCSDSFLPMFYYNLALRRCFTFIYGGCGGNGNRFESVEECESVCLHGGQPAESVPAPAEEEPEVQTVVYPTEAPATPELEPETEEPEYQPAEPDYESEYDYRTPEPEYQAPEPEEEEETPEPEVQTSTPEPDYDTTDLEPIFPDADQEPTIEPNYFGPDADYYDYEYDDYY